MVSPSSLLPTLYAFWRHPSVAREDLVAFQNEQLRRLVAHAYDNVPYYRELFDQHGLKPNDIRSTADLHAIPITTKKDLQSLPEEEVVARSVDPHRLITRLTSGSSGEPLTIRRTWLETRLLQALRLRAMHDFGLRLTDKVANIVLTRSLHPRDTQFPLSLLRSLGLYRRRHVNCLLPPRDIISELRQFCPDVIGGFAGALTRVAQIVGEYDRRTVRPRFIAVGGEVLTSLMRRSIAEAFAAPVFDLYASQEFILLAWECPQTGEFHTCDDSVIIEVLKDGIPAAEGERGEVVATNLHAFAMPFIRYRLGDIVTKGAETCRCGKPYATIRAVQGRMLDYFPLPGGRVIHPYEILLILLHGAAPWIRQYQLLQEREDHIILQVVSSPFPTPAELLHAQEAVSSLLGPEVEFRIMLVPEINLEPNGKFRVSRSLVRSAYDGIEWNQSAAPRSAPVGQQSDG